MHFLSVKFCAFVFFLLLRRFINPNHNDMRNLLSILESANIFRIQDDDYSPTSWDQNPEESDQDYQDRMEDQESYLEHFL